MQMKLSYDPVKRATTLEERGLDFADAQHVFAGDTFEFEDTRFDYGETRMLCYGDLKGRHVVVCYVQRGAVRHIISMRKCHEKEWEKIWF